MRLLRFKRYRHYVQAQRDTLSKRGMGPYYTDEEISTISEWLLVRGPSPRRAVCHGARNGREVDDFVEHFPYLDAFGTDMFPHSGRSANYKPLSKVIQCDFSSENKDWIGKFDFVYSNCLDHARNPAKTLRVWLAQLSDGRYLFLQHVVNPSPIPYKGDCFAANLDELIDLANEVGRVRDLLYVNVEQDERNLRRRRACHVVVLVVSQE